MNPYNFFRTEQMDTYMKPWRERAAQAALEDEKENFLQVKGVKGSYLTVTKWLTPAELKDEIHKDCSFNIALGELLIGGDINREKNIFLTSLLESTIGAVQLKSDRKNDTSTLILTVTAVSIGTKKIWIAGRDGFISHIQAEKFDDQKRGKTIETYGELKTPFLMYASEKQWRNLTDKQEKICRCLNSQFVFLPKEFRHE